MARKFRRSGFETSTARGKLPRRKKPHVAAQLTEGVILQYRRNKKNGAWVVKVATGNPKSPYWTNAFARADDYEPSNGKDVLTFFEAQDAARKLASRDEADGNGDRPPTVDEALTGYERDLEARGANPYNARQPRKYVPVWMLEKPVQLLDTPECRRVRDSMIPKMTGSSLNRTLKSLRAGLNHVADHDPRIKNRAAWRIGFAGLPNTHNPRNAVLSDAHVSAFVADAHRRNDGFGLFTDVMAITGARPSQISRLQVHDLIAHRSEPRLMMPKSAKGGGKNRVEKKNARTSMPITVALAAKLKTAAKGRAPDALLLLRTNGMPWGERPGDAYRADVTGIVKALKLEDGITIYALRHSSIVRALKCGVPIALVADLHDTSVTEIERTYAAFISQHADDIARRALLHHEPTAENAVPLAS